MKKLKFLFLIDPIESLNNKIETTFFLMKEVCRRGHACFIATLPELFAEKDQLFVLATAIEVRFKKNFLYQLKKSSKTVVCDFDVVLLRKDPPVDVRYIDHLTMLEGMCSHNMVRPPRSGVPCAGEPHHVHGKQSGHPELRRRITRPIFINSPSGIKRASEKLFPLSIPGISPPSLVSSHKEVLLSFLNLHKHVVVKPLDSFGGEGIFVLRHTDEDRKSLLEMGTSGFKNYVLMQQFIPEAKKGDKRIMLWNGEVLGSFIRVAGKEDFRCNLHSGGHFEAYKVTKRDHEIVQTIKPHLLKLGLYFVGLDIIGNYVTEINSTSPMGIHAINQLENSQIEKNILNSIETLVD
ncbi:MAG TPA: hypothetical protein DDW49_01155 [Deltaproteobacteria bacterium]|nr:MAG: hypothetical protein A2048_08400 [Deltaproteobacteria bacterium GWA2_45_12]HBF11990.1 hypothetical protein [Deltaproteobacteria bacterium]